MTSSFAYLNNTDCTEFHHVEIVTFVGTAVFRNCSYVSNTRVTPWAMAVYSLSKYGSVGNGLYAYLCDIVALCISQKKVLIIRSTTGWLAPYYIRIFERSSHVPVNVNRQVGVCLQYTAFWAPTSLHLRFSSEMEVVKLPKYVKIGVLGGRNTSGFSCRPSRSVGWRAILYRTVST